MKGLFCTTTAKNNEEYRKIIRNRMIYMFTILFIGLTTLTISLLADYVWTVKISEQMLSVYCGAGTGLTIVAIILLIKNSLLLKSEEKLKESRLSNSDERIQDISNRSFRIASIFLLIGLYAVGLIGGLFYPILMQVLSIMVCLFLVAYVVSFKVFEKIM